MATRSTISVEQDGTIRQIYCHNDGYLSHNGLILLDNYKDLEKINELMDLGDLSFLGEDIGQEQDFNNPCRNWCLSYGRDRKEEFVDARTYSSFKHFISDSIQEDYNYFFKEGKWYLYDNNDFSLILLTKEMCKND